MDKLELDDRKLKRDLIELGIGKEKADEMFQMIKGSYGLDNDFPKYTKMIKLSNGKKDYTLDEKIFQCLKMKKNPDKGDWYKMIISQQIKDIDSYIFDYDHFIKTGENNRKFNINRNSNNMIKFPLLVPKNNTKKHCSSVYRRIKSIE